MAASALEQGGLIIAAAGALLAAGAAVSLLAERLRLPALVLFLGVGMAVGSDGAGLIEFGRRPEDYELTLFVGTLALAAILYEAGLDAGWSEIRPVLAPAVSLALVGTFGTAALTGLAAVLLLDLPLLQGLLLGSILAASDGAAVFALLRGANLPRRVSRTLEGEAGFNDPVAVLLVLGLVELILHPELGVVGILALFAKEIAIGTAVGLVLPRLMIPLVRRAGSAPLGIHFLSSLTALALAYGGAAALGGSGFLAVYLAGLAFGGRDLPAQESLRVFHQGLAQLAEVALFLTLGLLIFPSQIPAVFVGALVLALVVAFVARPLAAAAALALAKFSARERIVIGWAGLRGGVPVVLATIPVVAGVARSVEFFTVAFFAVLVSTLIQGATVRPLARRLGVAGE